MARLTKKDLNSRSAKLAAKRDASTDYENPNQTLTFDQWCRLNNISRSTGKRVLGAGLCEFVRLSPKRIGITVGQNRKYLARCAQKAG